jgi:ribosomal protein S12 methylthiotransferase
VGGAAANALPGPLAPEIREERRARLMLLQEEISARKLKAKLGRTLDVLVDAPGVGRTKADAPEIDGLVKFRGGQPGEFAKVAIERADAHDLFGRLQ